MTNLNQIILNYKKFLESSWESFALALDAIKDEDLREDNINDWLQANWEFLVEAVLCKPGSEYLEVYGDGADCNGASSRVCFPDKLPTHKICCQNRSKMKSLDLLTNTYVDISDFDFHSFVRFGDGQYYNSPLFNAVLLESQEGQYIINLDEINFSKITV